MSVKRGVRVGVYLFSKECCFRARVDTNANPNPNPNLTLKQHSLKKKKQQQQMIDPDPDPHPHPDPRFPDTHKNINSPSPIMIKQVKTKQLNLQSPLNQRIVKMATGFYKAIHGYKVPRGIGELLHERSELIIILEQDTSSSYPK